MTIDDQNKFKLILSNVDQEDSIELVGIILESMYSKADIMDIKSINSRLNRLITSIYNKYHDIKWQECNQEGHKFGNWEPVNNMYSFVRDYEGDSHYEEYACYERTCSHCGYKERKRINLEEVRKHTKKRAK